MVNNLYIKCQVCSSITRIRLQMGNLIYHPIIVTCGKCKTSLSGEVKFLPETEYHFNNADIIFQKDLLNADYLVESAGEFPVYKQSLDSKENIVSDTPFIRIISGIKNNDKIEEFFETVNSLKNTSEDWEKINRVFSLFKNKSEYLVSEIKKVFSGEFFQCRDSIETLRAVHMFDVHYFYSPLKSDILTNKSYFKDFINLDSCQVKELIETLNSTEGYRIDELRMSIERLYEEFIKIYTSLIPAICVQYIGEENFDFEKEGTSTSTFDTVKQFYLDVYESLGNLLIIPFTLDNIKYRGKAFDFGSDKITSIKDFITCSKAKRFSCCNDNELFTKLMEVKGNNKLRNSIGHNDVDYDSVTQLITYSPDPCDRTKKKNIYLLQYEIEAIAMFKAVLTISEYIYRIYQFQLIHESEEFISYFASIIDPYSLCPCCSGKKFKFCHGKKS